MTKETNIDCMKYRKSTHIAGVDVETIISEKGKCVLTIKEAYYAKGVDVSGNKTDGYFLEFVEDVKPMVVNSINRKTIASIVKDFKKCTPSESRNIGNWIGVQLELTFDDSVKMMGKVVGGIRVKYQLPINTATDTNALALLDNCSSLDGLQSTWMSLSADEKKLATVIAKKETLKNKLK
jgi:hypothetical protein